MKKEDSIEDLALNATLVPVPEPEKKYSDNILDMMSYSSKCIH